MTRWPDLDQEAIRRSNRKQALVPAGATVLEPVGTAPGLVVPPPSEAAARRSSCCPGPPRELQPMWRAAVETEAFRAATTRRHRATASTCCGCSGSRSRRSPTRCCRRARPGSTSTRWRSRPACGAARSRSSRATSRRSRRSTTRSRRWWREQPPARRSSPTDGTSVDEQVAALLRASSRTIATAESCTGGLLAGRLTDLAGSSDYVLGGVVVYSNAAKVGAGRRRPRG